MKLLTLFTLVLLSGRAFSERMALRVDEEAPIQGKISMLGEMFVLTGVRIPVKNVSGVNFEYGFIIPKGNFDAILSFTAEHNSFPEKVVNSKAGDNDTNAAHVGGKAGVMYPLSTRFGLAPLAVLGYEKSSIQKRPWFGKKDTALNSSDIYFTELGAFAYHKKYVTRFAFRFSTAVYSKIGLYWSFGVSY